ncbi:MAG: hypothetical protein ACTHKL_26940 [Streptosporangiaceae bacterium]
MPIDLIDIPAAVADYLDNQVKTAVSPVIGNPSEKGVLTPGQNGTFTVTVTNRGMPDGVRLTNVTCHVKISDESIAQLIVPDAVTAQSYDTLAGITPLQPGSKRAAMFVRLPAGAMLDVGESQPLQIEVHCRDQGDAKITCHVHADIDQSDLFPTSQNPNGEQTVSVSRGVL